MLEIEYAAEFFRIAISFPSRTVCKLFNTICVLL